jgi:hypothetical protein
MSIKITLEYVDNTLNVEFSEELMNCDEEQFVGILQDCINSLNNSLLGAEQS